MGLRRIACLLLLVAGCASGVPAHRDGAAPPPSTDSSPPGDSGDGDAGPDDGGEEDGATPPMDTGVPPMDTGIPPMDTGVPPMDTGVPPMDTGPRDTGGCVPVAETCNGTDDDCDTRVDENPSDGSVYYDDEDSDGFGDPATARRACSPPAGAVTNGDDCDDTRGDARPTASEVCNGEDDDCDGSADDGGVCPADCQGRLFGGHEYLLCTGTLTWISAQSRCTTAGHRFVRIDSAAENEFLRIAAAETGIGDAWIGANDVGAESDWRWADNTQFWIGTASGASVAGRYSNWAAGEPNNDGIEDCGKLESVGTWTDTECSVGEDWICERY